MSLANRVVLVTGCSTGGIGYALCEEFAKKGCSVYATSRRAETIAPFATGSVERLALDVNSDESVAAVIKHIVDKEGKIDVVVNNAGVTSPGPLVDQPLQAVKEVFETNVFAVLRVTNTVVPIMAKQRSGTIVNIGSIVGEIPTAWSGVYASSKAALASLSQVLYMELQPFNISVVHVAPGAIKSNIADNGTARLNIAPNTLYSDYIPSIMARIRSSQGPNSMPNKQFAAVLVSKVLSSKPPRYVTLGGNSTVFKIFQWLPRTFVLYILWKTFSPRK